MRLFSCDACKNTLHFDNDTCVVCNNHLGYLPEQQVMTAIEPSGDLWTSRGVGRNFALCVNAADGCNWLVPADEAGSCCLACRHNRIIPDLATDGARAAFRHLLASERHLFYSLIEWRLPMPDRRDDPEGGLAFDFLADEPAPNGASGGEVLTGHVNGVITLAIAEADDTERERRRTLLGEPFRTLLGHFRHEIGHYYWDRLVRRGDALEPFRALFGDERTDYSEALDRNYVYGPPDAWQTRNVSAYAACHPWEDFAETFAHYMHMVDALETAFALDLRLEPHGAAPGGALDFGHGISPYNQSDFSVLVTAWPALTVAINELNRSLGQRDVYPFVLGETVDTKLAFVHDLIQRNKAAIRR